MNRHDSNRRLAGGVALVLLSLLVAGCGISKPFPEKGLYAIEAGQPDHSATQPTSAANGATQTILQVPQLRIATPYDGSSFIYRVGPQRFTSDYYNGFITAPASLLTGQLISYLAGSGIYDYVVDGNSAVDYRLILEGNVTELYGDYIRPKSPQAVIAIHFFVLRPTSDGMVVVHDKLYRTSQPAEGEGADALVKAWGAAYRQILGNLAADLRSLGTAASAGDPHVSAR